MSNVSEALVRAAHRAGQQPFFLASVLHDYQAAHDLDDTALASLLSCHADDLPRLALCRRPSASTFAADIDHLAQRFQLQGDQLAMIIRQVDTLAALRLQFGSQASDRFLRAARDRDELESQDQEGNNE